MTEPRDPKKPPGVQGGDQEVSSDGQPPAGAPPEPDKDGGMISDGGAVVPPTREGGMISEG